MAYRSSSFKKYGNFGGASTFVLLREFVLCSQKSMAMWEGEKFREVGNADDIEENFDNILVTHDRSSGLP